MSATILIVDDSPDTVEMLSTWLRVEGYQTFSAYGGHEALAVAARQQPDLILLDVAMPIIDGIETCRRLRTMPETADIPVILVTARNPAEARAEGLLAGAVDYITKPVNLPDLSERIAAALHDRDVRLLNTSRLLEELVHSALATLPCDLAWMLEVEEQEQLLQTRALASVQGDEVFAQPVLESGRSLAELEFPLSDEVNPLTGVLTTRRAVLNVPIRQMARIGAGEFYRLFQRLGLSYASLVPLTVGSRAVGVLVLATAEKTDLESPRGGQVITALASQAAIALDYVRLVRRLTEQEELMRAEQAFRQMILDTMGEGLAVIGPAGEIEYANNRLLRMTGYTRQEIDGCSIDILFHPDDRTQLKSALLQKRGATMKFDQRLYTKTGQEIPVILSRSSFTAIDPNAAEQVLVVSDRTEQKRREEALQLQSQRLQALNQAARVMTASLSPHEVITRILHAAVDVVEAEGASILLRSTENPDELIFMAAVGPQADRMAGLTVPLGQGIAGWVAREARSQLVADTSKDDRFYRDIDQSTGLATRSLVAIPLIVAEKAIGVLEVINKRGRPFDLEDVTLLEGMAGTAAVAIDNARLFNQTRRRLTELGTLLDASAAVSSTLDFGSVLELIVRRLADALRVQRCMIISWDRSSNTLGSLAEVVHASWPSGEGPISDLAYLPLRQAALKSGLPMLAHMSDSRTESAVRAELAWTDQQAVLGVPLWIGGRVVGLLMLYSNLRDHHFDETDVAEVDRLVRRWEGNLSSLAADGWRHPQELAALSDQLLALHGVTWVAVEEWLPDQNRTCRLSEYGFAAWTDHKSSPRNLDDFPTIRRVLSVAHPRVTGVWSLPEGSPERQFLERLGGQVSLMVPLIVRGQTEGVVNLIDTTPERVFDTEEVSLCQGIANVVSNAIENAHLYQSLERRASALEAAYAEVQQADRLKDELIQNLSHEIQTPLLHILGYVELMLDDTFGPLNPEQRDKLQFVAQRAQDLANLAKDIISVQALQQETMALKPTDIGGIIRHVVNNRKLQASRQNVVLEVRAASDLPLAMADPGRLTEALGHLVDNAIKFSHQGGIVEITVSSQPTTLAVRIQDQGVGIPAEAQRHIFERFYQADGSSTRQFGGAGLGLSIVHEIVTRHGGQIWVESEPGQGSIFTFTVPRADTASLPDQAARSSASEADPV